MYHNLLLVLEIILALVLIISVFMQPSKSDGLRGFIGGSSETFFAKNKSRTREALLVKVTIVSAILFSIVTLLLNII